jgi:hypothetical protein
LVETSVAAEGIEVAEAGTYSTTGNVVIPADTFVDNVKVSGTSIVTPAN